MRVWQNEVVDDVGVAVGKVLTVRLLSLEFVLVLSKPVIFGL